ncbi:hypothetical protein BKA70DRAFT_1233153 [Coprinopsis sp. MPI-PUGE-AT-0042]|nr:hypothetical protein BKA70DRAFT_1233153 [Coprinopsis sp. MPI-PUGE-AT-0042]
MILWQWCLGDELELERDKAIELRYANLRRPTKGRAARLRKHRDTLSSQPRSDSDHEREVGGIPRTTTTGQEMKPPGAVQGVQTPREGSYRVVRRGGLRVSSLTIRLEGVLWAASIFTIGALCGVWVVLTLSAVGHTFQVNGGARAHTGSGAQHLLLACGET